MNKRKILLERNDVVAKRCVFLREIRKLNFDDIVWLDETWVNVGHCPSNVWTDNTCEGSMSVPIGKGGRLILLHAGMSSGFVPNCMLLFTSKSSKDYHEEMCHETFMKWFSESLLPNLHKPSIIVMDNAPHHSKVLDKAPTTSTRKQDIIDWLTRNNVNYDEDMKKAELLDLVNSNKPPKQYIIDVLAKQHGHKVVRLPPYHCQFNSIELVWAQVKGYVAKHNKAFNLTEIKTLTHEGIHSVTDQDWKKVVEHTKKEIDSAWTKEGLIEDAVERMIISLNDEGDTSSDEEEGLPEDEVDHEDQYPDEDLYVSDYSEDEDRNQDGADNLDLSGVFPVSPRNEKILSFSEF